MVDEPHMPTATAARRRFGARLVAGLLGLALATASAQPAVTVTRLLPASRVLSGYEFQADLVVEVSGTAPAALIVEEEPPAGWVVTAATWRCDGRDEPFPPVVSAGRCKWLFEPLGFPVGSGLLQMTLALPAAAAGCHLFGGEAKWFSGAAEAGAAVDHQKALAVSTLGTGWNSLALPFPVPDLAALNGLLADEGGQRLLVGPPWLWDAAAGYVPSTGPLAAAQGFMGYIAAPGPRHLLVAATPAADLHLHPGWNLTGVCQELTLAEFRASAPTVGPVGLWDTSLRTYRWLPDTATLRPGCAYWVCLGSTEPAVIPLEHER